MKVDTDGREAEVPADRNQRTGLRIVGGVGHELHGTKYLAGGAAIDVENPAFVPPHFRLVMASGSAIHECRIVWIQQKRIGVTFDAAPQVNAMPE